MPATGNFYLTTAIPYVNAEPHLGHALELVHADVLARHRRRRGQPVRFLTGTDDNAVKNVSAARAAGVPVREFVDRNAASFARLRDPLALSFDDFIRTSADPRHRAGVERLWRQCADRGDLYLRDYQGRYCAGCEQFYQPAELDRGLCPEHGVPPEPVTERNWFFRLSRYAGQLRSVLESGRVRVEPAARRNEVLAFVRAGLADFSVSRPAQRAGGWGIPVPGDPGQTIYVWWDALANYITALGYGSADEQPYRDWWLTAAERVHVIGKGILRFHAVSWLALLLSAGQPLPDVIYVHEYLTAGGSKLSKSTGGAASPCQLAAEFGTDAVRWWLLREVARTGDTDFTPGRLVRRANQDLANGLGNLQHRTLSLVHRYRYGRLPAPGQAAGPLAAACDALPRLIDESLAGFDFRAAAGAVSAVVATGNRLAETERPWELARREADGDRAAADRLDRVLAVLVHACRVLAAEVGPFLPAGAAALGRQLQPGPGHAAPPEPVFTRLRAPA
ncbi:MAG: methionine--tRNA ligase [Nocardiopsaceae bacterium]|jgi:methionyl-tRNA synthetase|nr:methionine--tRNA ligase [Nocardiopsaceae bacterium]